MAKKITTKDLMGNQVLMDKARTFYSHVKKMIDFGMYADIDTFIWLWGEEEGKRLWLSFVNDCNRDIFKFFEGYLNNWEYLELLSNLDERDNLRFVLYER